jgi:hypothetical protein
MNKKFPNFPLKAELSGPSQTEFEVYQWSQARISSLSCKSSIDIGSGSEINGTISAIYSSTYQITHTTTIFYRNNSNDSGYFYLFVF